jgi:hypothetical protein
MHKSSTVMTFLFGSGKTFQEKIRTVAKLALEHSSNLAAFAGLYKVSISRGQNVVCYEVKGCILFLQIYTCLITILLLQWMFHYILADTVHAQGSMSQNKSNAKAADDCPYQQQQYHQ